MNRQPLHIVGQSPWPVSVAAGSFCFAVGLVMWVSGFHSFFLLVLGSITVSFGVSFWWRDVIRESTFIGCHTSVVNNAHQVGMLLFIASEVMFFLAFLWAFLYSSINSHDSLGCVWPPVGVSPIYPFSLPLLNTGILVSSSVSVTWAHHALITDNQNDSCSGVLITVELAILLMALQLNEYLDANFCISDSVFGSIFYVSTGLHGFHVMVGAIFMSVVAYRVSKGHFSSTHHVGAECALWYWHFVDVVWLMLLVFMYWWGG